MELITNWFRRVLANPQLVFLGVFLLVLFLILVTMGQMLAPVVGSVVIAYLLEGIVASLQRRGVPRLLAVVFVFVTFVLFVASILFGILPLLSRQVTELFQQIPMMLSNGEKALMALPEAYPELVTPEQIIELIGVVRREIAAWGQHILSVSVASVVGIITVLIYLFLMPLLVFFFLKDKDLIIAWFQRYLPKHHGVAGRVWCEVDRKISNYVRGKFWEILIVWGVSYLVFELFGLNYALLLGLVVGLSVVIPYIGASVVTVPVVLVAWFQWGWSSEFVWLSISYLIIQILDGNVLVPLLFSEVVNLHPVAIIVAILVFGGLWGFWGVFFAIPLATLVQATLSAWPRDLGEESDQESEPVAG